ncbi:hypothetical protein SAY86_002451 [Trapa natans]|uniref:Uncharacterized protein n=1 Tax=Trapa natans TaxID=22666 RepID=A0AAN7R0N5_TRANT|nr:hypothetical protein SAY86_002451 [Trapa natans]
MSLFGLGSRNQKTFRPKKSAPSGTKGAQLQKHIDATLGSGNLREAVRLPPGEDINEWLAVNSKRFLYSAKNSSHQSFPDSSYAFGAAVDFFNQVNILYGTLTEFCTSTNCPTMSAGPKYGTFLLPLLLVYHAQSIHGLTVLDAGMSTGGLMGLQSRSQ